ncbi:hypothetical protein GCM10010277_79150 [Streptomyces longisporoflavus]|nr:hypothetical protein GCM10010277_79150 [Streptomyces longisporoflavus]
MAAPASRRVRVARVRPSSVARRAQTRRIAPGPVSRRQRRKWRGGTCPLSAKDPLPLRTVGTSDAKGFRWASGSGAAPSVPGSVGLSDRRSPPFLCLRMYEGKMGGALRAVARELRGRETP